MTCTRARKISMQPQNACYRPGTLQTSRYFSKWSTASISCCSSGQRSATTILCATIPLPPNKRLTSVPRPDERMLHNARPMRQPFDDTSTCSPALSTWRTSRPVNTPCEGTYGKQFHSDELQDARTSPCPHLEGEVPTVASL